MVALGSWRGPWRSLGDLVEALEELRSDVGGLGWFWGPSCPSQNDNKTDLFKVFLLTFVFQFVFVTNLYKMIAPRSVNIW